MRILIAEDAAALAIALLHTWRGRAMRSTAWGMACRPMRRSSPILDLGLPKLDGLEVLERARAQKIRVPILILAARDSADERVRGLDLGADDYLAKPFSISELQARVRALLRRSPRGKFYVDTGGSGFGVHCLQNSAAPRCQACCPPG